MQGKEARGNEAIGMQIQGTEATRHRVIQMQGKEAIG